MKRSSGSAEQSANDMQPAEYMTGTFLPPPGTDQNRTTKPDGYGGFYRLAFYNIGWVIESKQQRHTKQNLAREICDIVLDKRLDASIFGFSNWSHLAGKTRKQL